MFTRTVDRRAKRQMVAAHQLPDLIHRMRKLEKQAQALTVKCCG